jgi:YegS/Rv2252/BmrU family lipid kinase
MRVKVIANPAAKMGGAGRAWPEIAAKLTAAVGGFDVSHTTAPGEATQIARAAVAEGYDHVVAVGGDGTVNEVVNGLMRDDAVANPAITLCPVPAGTANELCRGLGILAGDRAFRAIAEGSRVRIDLGRVQCAGLDGGSPRTRYVFVAASFGSAAEISWRTSTSRYIKRLGGELSYYLVTLIVVLSYKPTLLHVTVDDHYDATIPVHSALGCNTEHTGGGMRLAPGARLDDGLLDLVLFKDMRARDLLLKPPSWLFQGRHVEHPEVEIVRGRVFRVDGDPKVMVDADGETIGRLPLSLEVLPAALPVKRL